MGLAEAINRLPKVIHAYLTGTPEERRRAEKELKFAERYGHSPHMTREQLLPYLGQRVTVHLTQHSMEKLHHWNPQAAEKFTARVSYLSDLGEIRAYFDMSGRPKTGWDVPIKCIKNVTRA